MSFEDNTVNNDGSTSIQQVKLAQRVRDKTQRTQQWADLDLWATLRLEKLSGSGATASNTSALSEKHELQQSGEQHLAADQ